MAANYVLLERVELNSNTTNITFANIPQTGYTDLKIVGSTRFSSAVSMGSFGIAFNGSTANITGIMMLGQGSGSTPGSGAYILMDSNGASDTASSFANWELLIPNYTGSTLKSFSFDGVTEAAASYAEVLTTAGVWASTSAITSFSVNGAWGTYSTFSLYGLAATGTTPAIAPKATGGNLVTTDGTYWYHTFTSSGYFTPSAGLTCDYLVVAGGGGGGTGQGGGGGGGAGGLRSTVDATGGGGSLESAISVVAQAYTIQVGAGGAGGVGSAIKGTNGVNSIFSTITSTGGGGGSGGSTGNGAQTGGSGGGGNFFVSSGAGASGTTNQGYAGGTGADANAYGGGGGGGAGAVGSNGTTTIGGNGGNGVATSITGSSVTYAGGGGGGRNDAGTLSSGGTGGGGSGGGNNVNNAVAGTINLGGGGGAGGGGNQPGKDGGSGIVIIRYTV